MTRMSRVVESSTRNADEYECRCRGFEAFTLVSLWWLWLAPPGAVSIESAANVERSA